MSLARWPLKALRLEASSENTLGWRVFCGRAGPDGPNDLTQCGERTMFKYELEHICSYSATLRQPMEVIGETPLGLRINAYIAGGEVSGPRLRGKILGVGADWLTIRTDGVGMLDVRATMETQDGALIYVAYNGVMDFGPDGYQRVVAGNPPARIAIQAVPRFLTAHPEYLWLNRLQCLNVGMADFAASTVTYDTYVVHSKVQ
jgi:hypothetical protein